MFSLFLHVLPLFVPFVEGSFHVVFFSLHRGESGLRAVTESDVGIMEEREKRV